MTARRTAAILSLALCTAAGAANAQTPAGEEGPQVEEAREQYRQGVAAFRARHFGDAVIAFQRSFRARPHFSTLYNMAESLLRAGDRAGAIERLRELLAMTSPAPDAPTIERARVLAREAGVEDLQPVAAPRGPECPACPACASAPSCPPATGTTRVVTASHGPVPWILGGAGVVLLAGGMYFYAAALADSNAYNHPGAADSLRVALRDEGQTFTVVGAVGLIAGVGLLATSIVLFAMPPAAPREHAVLAPPRTSARVDFVLTGAVLSGTF